MHLNHSLLSEILLYARYVDDDLFIAWKHNHLASDVEQHLTRPEYGLKLNLTQTSQRLISRHKDFSGTQ